ncbi:dihydrodipicolinate synthase family protein [Clostridium sp. Marseille-P2415]|uniref:dihydrodipicolinate synthase family protein n=1 Tax=Clostridium sp. Marseille-P2415 TaxID=1805471 RepID=UPI0009888664|nr:dihydrodipicolinate synthase family protein [Clostridium sp. Marseille-P2415]
MYKIITPVVTVFDKHEKPDYEANKKVIDFLIEGGVDGILVLGSTGEFTGLSKKEKSDFFRFYAEYTNGRVELYAGTGSTNFEETVELSNEIYSMGYAAPMVIGPYYYGLDQEKLFIFYDTLAKCVKGDLYIYNFPARTGHSIAPKTVKKLLEANQNIVGLKDSVAEPNHTNLICLEAGAHPFLAYSGFDDQFLYNISSGGNGCIGGLSNIVPEIWSDLVRAANEKDFDRSMKLSYLIHQLMPLYDMDSNFSLLFKKLMIQRGVDISPKAIFPFDQLEEEIYKNAGKLMDHVIDEYKKLTDH